MSKQNEIMNEVFRVALTSNTFSLDVSKINTLEDVKRVLEGLDIKVTVLNGTTNKQYEALKEYLK